VTTAPLLAPGSLAIVCQWTFLVEDVRSAPGTASVVSLARVDDDAPGHDFDVIWDARIDGEIRRTDGEEDPK
jgi:hypothetical protein